MRSALRAAVEVQRIACYPICVGAACLTRNGAGCRKGQGIGTGTGTSEAAEVPVTNAVLPISRVKVISICVAAMGANLVVSKPKKKDFVGW